IFRQDAVLYKTDHTILRILVKFSWHIPDFPIYSNGTKPGTLQLFQGMRRPSHESPGSHQKHWINGGFCAFCHDLPCR
ncbi:hypothetical protein ACL1CA_14290, partial [Corynebacterium striatum]